MRTLMLLRHAKAEAHSPGGDFERQLAAKGVADAGRLARHLAETGMRPDTAFVSAARRTCETFDIVQDGFERAGAAIPTRIEESLYNATAYQLRDLLRVVEPDVANLLVVGHNPGLMEAAVMLARDGDVVELERLRHRFPPCALAIITFDTEDWLDARAAGGRLDLLLMPEDLAVGG